MTKITISELEATDVLGVVMFGLGLAILFESVTVPINRYTAGVSLMILGVGAVFGRETFVELVKEIVLPTGEKDGGSDGESIDSGGDDESDDGEAGIDRPPGEDEVTATK